MSEKRLLINNLTLSYKGLFNAEEVINEIAKLVEEKGYTKHEKKTEEQVVPEGKNVYVEFRPNKTKTAYCSLMIYIKVHFDNVREEEVMINGAKRRMQKGNVTVVFDAWTTTDYQSRWGMKPWFYFLKAIIHKFVYRFPLEEGFEGEVAEDTRHVYEQLKSFLNLYKYKVEEKKEE